jgi:hypothetical protein
VSSGERKSAQTNEAPTKINNGVAFSGKYFLTAKKQKVTKCKQSKFVWIVLSLVYRFFFFFLLFRARFFKKWALLKSFRCPSVPYFFAICKPRRLKIKI